MMQTKKLRFAAVLVVVLAISTLIGPRWLQAAVDKPSSDDRIVARTIVVLMRTKHLSKHALDDEISRRAIESFLNTLDPMKVYFLQSDADEFMKNRDKIDDMVRKGDVSFAFTVFKRFLERIDERVEIIDELLKEKHDFTIDEEMLTDPDAVRYARNAEESRERWRKRIKYDLLVQKDDKKDEKEAVEKLERRYHSFAKRMKQFDNDELLEMYLTAVTTSYDPHTTVMSAESFENFKISLSLKLEGIGAALRSTDGQTIVTKVIPGGAADKHGKLKVEDKIIGVGQGEQGEMVDIVDMKLNDVVQMIRGDAGTKVRLEVMTTGDEVTTYTITRAEILLKDSEARSVIFEAGKKPNGKPMKIGVIDLPSFYMDMDAARAGDRNFKSTTRDVRKLLDEFREKRVDGVVLNLRNNGGGSLSEAINCTGLFIDRGPVVQVKDTDGFVQAYDDIQRGVSWDGPLVVVTSKFSASASEILAGAIKDYNRGIVIGDETTHGKGTVQSLMDLGKEMFPIEDTPNVGALKITQQQFYRANGDSTQKRGVPSDIVLPSITNHMDVSEADLDYAVEFDRVPEARYTKVDWINDNIRRMLKTKSAKRVAADEKFAGLQKKIDRYKEQKARKSVTLNEKKFLARRAEFDADKEDEKQFDEAQDGDKEIIKRDFYFEEVLSITADYINALEAKKVAQN